MAGLLGEGLAAVVPMRVQSHLQACAWFLLENYPLRPQGFHLFTSVSGFSASDKEPCPVWTEGGQEQASGVTH